MKLAVMDPANRHGQLVAHSASKRARLGKREVMRIRRRAGAVWQNAFSLVEKTHADTRRKQKRLGCIV
jgi:ABC-type ATPase involved in cell division